MNVSFTRISRNAKVGPIPVTMTSAESCPSTCPFKGAGCYAGVGPVSWGWKKVTTGERGSSWADMCSEVAALPKGQLWRHNVAGDLPHVDGLIDLSALAELVEANTGRKGFTFTHHEMKTPVNRMAVKLANREGFTVNLSADNMADADRKAALGIAPVAVVLPEKQLTNTVTPEGRKVVVCPAVTKDNVSCSTCGLCAKSDRKVIIGFPAHGAQKRKAELIAVA